MSYKLLTDASRGFLDTFNYMIRDNKRYIEEKEIERLNQELETTKRLLEESLKVIEFYGNPHSWTSGDNGNHKYIVMPNDFTSDNVAGIVSGKKAREFLNKLKNDRGE